MGNAPLHPPPGLDGGLVPVRVLRRGSIGSSAPHPRAGSDPTRPQENPCPQHSMTSPSGHSSQSVPSRTISVPFSSRASVPISPTRPSATPPSSPTGALSSGTLRGLPGRRWSCTPCRTPGSTCGPRRTPVTVRDGNILRAALYSCSSSTASTRTVRRCPSVGLSVGLRRGTCPGSRVSGRAGPALVGGGRPGGARAADGHQLGDAVPDPEQDEPDQERPQVVRGLTQ